MATDPQNNDPQCISEEALDCSELVIPPEELVCSEDVVDPVSIEKPKTPAQDASNLNFEDLRGHIPDDVLSQLPEVAQKFDINTNLRLVHFLAQCAVESGNFKKTKENLNYSAERLPKVFKKLFPTVDSAKPYAGQPEKLGNHVYASKNGNGDEASGDGYKYRGRGYIQLTGKNNYKTFSEFIGEDVEAQPDLVASRYPLASAAHFFKSNKIWTLCDKGRDDLVITSVTKRVNGGTNGLVERIDFFKKFYSFVYPKN